MFTGENNYRGAVLKALLRVVLGLLIPIGAGADELSAETILFQGFENVDEDSWGYTSNPGTGGLIEVTTNRCGSGSHSLRLRGSNRSNADPYIVFENVLLGAYTNVRLSVAFSAKGPDTDDYLNLDLSCDNGVTWQAADSLCLIAGYNNADIAFGETSSEKPITVSPNPYTVELPGYATQVMVRIRFDEKSNANGSLDSYYVDTIRLFYIPPGQPPMIRPLADQTAWVGYPLEFWVAADDIDHETITLRAENVPPGALFNSVSGEDSVSNLFSYTATPEQAGAVFITDFVAEDSLYQRQRSMAITVLDHVVNFTQERMWSAEGETAVIDVSISRPADATVCVAVAESGFNTGMDYTLSATTVVFSATGPAIQSISVVIANDGQPEGVESMTLTLVDPCNAFLGETNRFVLNVRDNDSFSVATANLSSGGGFYFRDPAKRILEGLRPDIVALQEFGVTNELGREDYIAHCLGEEYELFVGTGSLPCGIVSRWPILACGEWADPVAGGREFSWATIDLPGTRNLHVVSVHFYASGSTADREEEARLLTNYLYQADFDPDDFLLVCGDFNAQTRTDAAMLIMTNAVSDVHQPADQYGIRETNKSRTSPYDYVLPDPVLDACHLPMHLEGIEFPEGLVFDTRLWTNPPPPAPVQITDSDADLMAHMAVMKVFALQPMVRVTTLAGSNGSIYPSNPLLPAGSDCTFVIEPDLYYELAEVRTNHAALITAPNSGTYVFTWSNLTENAQLESLYTPRVTSQGTPEWWLADYGWTNNFETAAQNDPDDDGMQNWEEYVAGTDPLDPCSQFTLLAPERMDDTAYTIRWQSVSNRLYSVLCSTNLLNSFEVIATNIPATPPVNSYTGSYATGSAAFFRIDVR